MKSFITLLCAAVLAAGLAGCRSTRYYQNEAVQKARSFLLANSPELTPVQMAYVKYNKPVFLSDNIFDNKVSAPNDLNQVFITWRIPGRENWYIVYGVSNLRMNGWYPQRMIKKIFPKPDEKKIAAISNARRYALESLYFELPAKFYNQVRFANPDIVKTKFELLPPPPKSRVQYSLVWRSTTDDKCVVICGLAAPDMAGFAVSFGGVLSAQELAADTVAEEKAVLEIKK